MSEYTPTTEEVRGDYANFQLPARGGDFRSEYAEGVADFNRWLAAHDAEVRAEWEAEHRVTYRVIRDPQNPYLSEVHVVEKPEAGDQVTHIYRTLTERVPVEQGDET